jgi:hypothetical protein
VTEIRCCTCKRCRLSNYFDAVINGAAGSSSFMDGDAITHDGKRGRFLLQEFKYPEQLPMCKPQHWMLRDIAALPKHFTVWLVVRREDGFIGFAQFAPCSWDYELHTITPRQYRELFSHWWHDKRHPLFDIWDRERWQ